MSSRTATSQLLLQLRRARKELEVEQRQLGEATAQAGKEARMAEELYTRGQDLLARIAGSSEALAALRASAAAIAAASTSETADSRSADEATALALDVVRAAQTAVTDAQASAWSHPAVVTIRQHLERIPALQDELAGMTRTAQHTIAAISEHVTASINMATTALDTQDVELLERKAMAERALEVSVERLDELHECSKASRAREQALEDALAAARIKNDELRMWLHEHETAGVSAILDEIEVLAAQIRDGEGIVLAVQRETVETHEANQVAKEELEQAQRLLQMATEVHTMHRKADEEQAQLDAALEAAEQARESALAAQAEVNAEQARVELAKQAEAQRTETAQAIQNEFRLLATLLTDCMDISRRLFQRDNGIAPAAELARLQAAITRREEALATLLRETEAREVALMEQQAREAAKRAAAPPAPFAAVPPKVVVAKPVAKHSPLPTAAVALPPIGKPASGGSPIRRFAVRGRGSRGAGGDDDDSDSGLDDLDDLPVKRRVAVLPPARRPLARAPAAAPRRNLTPARTVDESAADFLFAM